MTAWKAGARVVVCNPHSLQATIDEQVKPGEAFEVQLGMIGAEPLVLVVIGEPAKVDNPEPREGRGKRGE